MDDGLQTIRDRFTAQAQADSRAQDAANEQALFSALARTIIQQNKVLIDYLGAATLDVAVINQQEFPTSIATPDTDKVVKAVKQLEKTVASKTDDDTQVIAAVKALIPYLQDIPKAIKLPEAPEPVESVTITNLQEVTKPLGEAIKLLQQSVKELKLDNKVDVAAPNVHVDAPDLMPLLTQLKAVEAAVGRIKLPEAPKLDLAAVIKASNDTTKAIRNLVFPVSSTPTDPLIKYAPADIDDVPAVQYFGYTDITGAWYIRRFDTSASPKTLRFAFGQSNYATNWTNRVALTYTIWGT